MLRLLAVIAFIVAIGSPTDAGTIQEWGFVATAAGLACFALEGSAFLGVRRNPVLGPHLA